MRVLRLLRALILTLLCSGTAGATGADTRIALVIGIGSYQFTPELPTAVTDARALATALRRNGFDVEEAYDLDDRAFTSRLRDFGARASTAAPSPAGDSRRNTASPTSTARGPTPGATWWRCRTPAYRRTQAVTDSA